MAVSHAPRREAAPSSGASHRSDGTVLDTRRPPHLRPGSLKELGRVPAQTHPRTPAPNYRDWELRDSDPGMASASMGSVFSCLLSSSSFCPSSVYRESLGHSLFPGRPFCPSHPGLPCCPGILGLRAGAASRRPYSGEG